MWMRRLSKVDLVVFLSLAAFLAGAKALILIKVVQLM